jgi:GNAT superfamily N-acetyltransferase
MTGVAKISPDFVFKDTEEFEDMRALARRSGLEDGGLDPFDEAHGCFLGDRLIGCAGLKVADGVFTVENLAVDEGFRNEGIGTVLVGMIEQDAKRRGATGIWALARAPAFFKRLGYVETDPPAGGKPSMLGCPACRQYKKTCTPALVFKAL